MTEARKRRLHLKLRWKIMLTIALVATGVVAVGAIQSYYANQPEGRGRFLRKHYNRFDEYRKGLGESLGAVAAFVALDPSLRAALVGRERATPGDGEAPGEGPSASEVFRRIVRAADATLEPSLVLLVDAQGEQVHVRGGTRLPPREVAGSRLVTDVLGGMSVVAELALLDGHVYQVSGAPVRGPDGEVVGGVILGERLERFLVDYQLQSDPNEVKQHRISLAGPEGPVLASVFPEGQLVDLAAALEEDAWEDAPEGDETVPIVLFDDGMWDFWSAPAQGYVGGGYGDMGTFFLMRTRDFKRAEWLEQFEGTIPIFVGSLLLALLVGYLLSVAITRRIVEEAGGRVRAEDAPGGGSRFHVSLPA